MFSQADIPSLDGKIVVITGANSGIGLEATKVLLARGARVILACRNEAKLHPVLHQLEALALRGTAEPLLLDLASLTSVASASSELKKRLTHIDVLINNAGVMALPESSTEDGFERHFGTNHLGHFALTGHLLPLLQAAPMGRIVTVSSLVHRGATIDFEAIRRPAVYKDRQQYAMSKLANLLFAYELDRRLKRSSSSAISVACQPGFCDTPLQPSGFALRKDWVAPTLMRLFTFLVAQSAARGALGTLYAAAMPVKGGEYIGPTGLFELRGAPVIHTSSQDSYDTALAQRLWTVSEELTGVHFAF